MRFTPKDDETIAKEQNFGDPFPKGEYDVQIVEAADEMSSNNREMIHLTVRIFNDEGHRRTAHDYLLEAIPKKLKSFCDAAGLQDEYSTGELSAAHCNGHELRAKVDIQPAKDGYDAKNVIREYLPRTTQPAAQRAQAPASAPAGGNGDGAKQMAWKNFLSKWSVHVITHPEDANNKQEAFHKACTEFYPNRDPRTLNSTEWMKIGTAFKVWDAVKGFPNMRGPSQAPPFGEDEKVFADSDIPFSHSGRMGPPI